MKLMTLVLVALPFFHSAKASGQTTPTAVFCSGDGSIGNCPCGNNGTAGRGCANSAVAMGALLTVSGTASISGDTLVLTGNDMVLGITSQFMQAQGIGSPVPFGDGLLCAHQGIQRLGIVFGQPTVSCPSPQTPTPLSMAGGQLVAGDVRHYQVWYRDSIGVFCPPAPYNLTQGLTITWSP